MTPLQTVLQQLREAGKRARQGPWDLEYGVSQRSAWQIDSRHKEIVLRLDGSANIDLDATTGRVEANQEFILLARNTWDALIDVAEAAGNLHEGVFSHVRVAPMTLPQSQKRADTFPVLYEALARLQTLVCEGGEK